MGGVKFGTEDGTEGLIHHAKFHCNRRNDKATGPQKLKNLLRFDQNVEYKRPAGAYPLRDFHKICTIEVLYHRVKFGGARISPAAEAAKTLSFCLFVCLSVCSSRF